MCRSGNGRYSVYVLLIFLGSFSLKGVSAIKAIPLDSTSTDKGWEQIKSNDNKSARSLFLTELKRDSLNQNALKGLLYLSDIEQDKLGYIKYANRLIGQTVPEPVFGIFKNAYTGTGDFIIRQKDYSERAKLPYKLLAAAQLKEKRRFRESANAFGELLGDYHWALLGPFKNISGSGHDFQFPIEREGFDSTKTYLNSLNIPLKWVKPKYYNREDKLIFSRYLPGSYNSSTYYANSFVNLVQGKTAQLRLGSSSPVKVWIDGVLIFDGALIRHFQWDGEIIELKLEAGVHRILLKCSTPSAAPKPSDLFSFFDTPEVSDVSTDDELSFALRITDSEGEPLKNKALMPCYGFGARPGGTLSGALIELQNNSLRLDDNRDIHYFQSEIAKHPDELFGYYALCKAYFMAGLTKEAEPFFVKALRNQKNSVLLKFLCAKLYAQNGKLEKAYEVLSAIDQEKNPVFSLLDNKFKEIDPATEPVKYLKALEGLKALTPSNYSVISAYLDFYDKRGMQKEKGTFISEMKKAFPEYTESLDAELDDNKTEKNLTEQEQTRGIKNTVSKTESHFSALDYSTAIAWYKNKGRVKKVLELYTELIKYVPWELEYRHNKAKYLIELSRYKEALDVLSDALSSAPYNTTTLENTGDIYSDKNKLNEFNSDAKALYYYKQAKKFQPEDPGLDSKISRIEGQKKLNILFRDKTFEEVLADPAWKTKYMMKGTDAVILLYTRDLVYDSNAHVEVYQQLMIKILSLAGARHWTEYDYSFMGNMNTLRVLKSNGTEVSPDKQGGYVVIKNLEPGDIIEMDGVQEWEQQTELDQELVFTHYISFEAPVYYHKFEVAVPQNKYLGYHYHKLDSTLKKTRHDGYDFYNWEYFNIPKLETEEAVPDAFDLYGSIMISTMPDWSKLTEWYQQTTYGKFELTYEVKEALDSILLPRANSLRLFEPDSGQLQQQKIEVIYNYLTKEINYSYVPFLQSGYVPKDPGLTLSSRIGDCKDVATLMIVMLRAIGIDAHYALVKSNAFNHQEMLPSLYFDHVVVQYELNRQQHFLDMTTDFYPWYVLTENDVNAWALVINKGESAFRLPADDLDTAKNKIEYTIDASLNTDKSIDLSVDAVYPGIAGGSLREYFSGISEQEQKNYLSAHLGKAVFSDLNLLNFRLEDKFEISKPLKASMQLKAEGFSDEVANLLVFQVPYMSAVQSSPAISGKHRHNTIDLDKIGNTAPAVQKIHMRFPKNYRLLKLPDAVNYESKYGTYKLVFRKTEEGLFVEKSLLFAKRIIPINEFDDFKAFYLKILNFDKTKIAIEQL